MTPKMDEVDWSKGLKASTLTQLARGSGELSKEPTQNQARKPVF
jgi:hypothetical protein